MKARWRSIRWWIFHRRRGEADEERYPPAGGGNPTVRVFVAPVGGGEAHAMDTGENGDIYIARVNWLTDSKHIAIQRLNRPQTVFGFADLRCSDGLGTRGAE